MRRLPPLESIGSRIVLLTQILCVLLGLLLIVMVRGQLGASVVSIMPDTERFTGEYVANNELPFPVLSDVDLGYSLSLGLIFWVGAEIIRLYQEVGIELEKYHGNQSYFLPMAAKFIVGRDGLVKARQVNIEFRERMEPEAILSALQDLRRG